MRQTELRGYLPPLRRWWPTLLASALIAGAAGAFLAAALPKMYEARSQLLVGPVNASAEGQRTAGTLARTYAELIVSETFLDAAVKELNLGQPTDELRRVVRASGSNTTRFVVILAEQDTPEKAAAVANFLADRLIGLAAEGRADSPEGSVSVIDPATPPTESSGPRLSVLALAAALAGGLSALLLAVAAEYFGDRVRDGDDLAKAAGHPLLGSVVLDSRRAPHRPSSQDDMALRRIASMMLLAADGAPRSIAVVPIDGNDGSLATMEIARAFTEFGKRVSVITYDPEGDVGSGTQPTGPKVLGAQVSSRSSLTKDKATSVVRTALSEADIALMASPPLGTSPHGLVWSSIAESTVLLADLQDVTRAVVHDSAEALTAAGAAIEGIVVVKGRRRSRSRGLGRASEALAR